MKPRPFGPIDALILVVAAAAGLAVNRLNWPAFVYRWRHPVDAHVTMDHFLDLLAPHLATVTIAVLAVRLRPPRPPLRRLVRRPGTVACMVVLAVLLAIACWAGMTMPTGRAVEFSEHAVKPKAGEHSRGSFPGSFALYPPNGRILVAYGDRIGFAIAGAWLALWLSGRWRSEPTWVDRLGRAMGWLWISFAVVIWLRCYSV